MFDLKLYLDKLGESIELAGYEIVLIENHRGRLLDDGSIDTAKGPRGRRTRLGIRNPDGTRTIIDVPDPVEDGSEPPEGGDGPAPVPLKAILEGLAT